MHRRRLSRWRAVLMLHLNLRQLCLSAFVCALCTGCGYGVQACKDFEEAPNNYLGRFYQADSGVKIPAAHEETLAFQADRYIQGSEHTTAATLADLRSCSNLNSASNNVDAGCPLIMRIDDFRIHKDKTAILFVRVMNKAFVDQSFWTSATIFFEHTHEIDAPIGRNLKPIHRYNCLTDLKAALKESSKEAQRAAKVKSRSEFKHAF